MPGFRLAEPRKAPSQARARATVEAILRATARVLARDGLDRASTNRIAQEAGVSIGSLYQYFPSKEALIAALVERHLEHTEAHLLELGAQAFSLPFEDGVRLLVSAVVRGHQEEPKLHRVVIEQLPPIAKPAAKRRLTERSVELVATYLAARGATAPVEQLRSAGFFVAKTVEACVHGALLERPDLLESGAVVEETVRLVVGYLRPLLPKGT